MRQSNMRSWSRSWKGEKMVSSFSWRTQVGSKLKAKLHFEVKFKAKGKTIFSNRLFNSLGHCHSGQQSIWVGSQIKKCWIIVHTKFQILRQPEIQKRTTHFLRRVPGSSLKQHCSTLVVQGFWGQCEQTNRRWTSFPQYSNWELLEWKQRNWAKWRREAFNWWLLLHRFSGLYRP